MNSSLHVKICGITTREALEACIELGIDSIGLNFVPGSRRFLPVPEAKALAEAARGRIQVVGVFQDPGLSELQTVLREIKLDAVQFNGDETPQTCASVPLQVWKAFAVYPGWDPAIVNRYKGLAVRLYDSRSAGEKSGGTGRAFDWSLLPTNPPRPWFLAGGLNLENIVKAVATKNPDGVDLNSGVESSPGVKSPELIQRMMEILARWRQRHDRQDIPGYRGSNLDIEGSIWAHWIFPENEGPSAEEEQAIAWLVEEHQNLVLDFRARRGQAAKSLSQYMRLQMMARSAGRHLKFWFDEEAIAALMRVSMVSVLDIVE